MTAAVSQESLEHWAQVKPARAAILDGDSVLTWQRWNAAADAVATALSRRGIGPTDVVAVRSRTRPEWAVLDAALGKLGCKMLALNWRLSTAEASYILSDSAVSAVICDDEEPQRLAAAWSGRALKAAVCVGPESAGFTSYASLLQEPAHRWEAAGDAPLIIYTSGTTGRPKGVYVGRPRPKAIDSLRRYMADLARVDAEGPDDVVLIAIPLHHGLGAGAVRRSARIGSTMVMTRHFDAEEALRVIQCHRITRWTAVPTMLFRVAALPDEVLKRYDLRSLRFIAVGGAPVPQWLKTWASATFGPILHEGYGTTETGLITALEPAQLVTKPHSSGRPYDGVDVSVRDAAGEPLPAGEFGEIWARTPVTASGYLDGAGSDDFDADGFFCTGDVGHLDEDGFLHITDRSKDVIITGGVNVYPAEIESVLRTHPAIEEVAVIGIPHDDYGELVLAVCQLRSGQAATEEELVSHCRRELAAFKLPRAVQFRHDLPRNSMGKVLKHQLRAPYWEKKERAI